MDTKVADVMSKEMLYCFDTDGIDDVARNMGKAQVRRLPVVNRDKRLVGIVSLGDLARNDDATTIGRNRDARFHAGRQARPDRRALSESDRRSGDDHHVRPSSPRGKHETPRAGIGIFAGAPLLAARRDQVSSGSSGSLRPQPIHKRTR